MSDLATLKTALGLYLTVTPNPDLQAGIANFCLAASNTSAKIGYSATTAIGPCTTNTAEGADVTSGSTFLTGDFCIESSSPSLVDGTGWIPVNLTGITGGAPIANLPLDPTNTIASIVAPVSTDLVYRYACQKNTTSTSPRDVFEIDAVLESAAYGPSGTDDKSAKDGGDNTAYYEVGTSPRLMGTGTNY